MFTGALTALITPFKNGLSAEIDEEALRKLVEEQIAGGINGLVPVGTTGESATLTHEEHQRVIKIVVDQSKKRVPVVAGTGSNNTREAVELTKAAKTLGADGALLISPYYNKPTQEGLFQHFAMVAHEAQFPLLVYNIPGRTAVTISPATLVRLADVPNIVGVKDATGNLENANKVFSLIGDRLTFLAGDDAMTLPLIAVGGKGVISAVANIVPHDMANYTRLSMEGNLKAARDYHRKLVPLIEAIFTETNPIPVKTAAALLGMCAEEFRLPLCKMAPANRANLREAIDAYGLKIASGQ
jgi:4-hydroxy-tetrahydrodipicolinate synthase